MSVHDPESSQRCSAHKRLGGVCGQWAMRGQAVCFLHGGKSPQALRKAEERMRDLVHPAISSLARQIAKDEFASTKYVLDWAGFREQTTTAENTVSVTITFDRADPTLSLPDAD